MKNFIILILLIVVVPLGLFGQQNQNISQGVVFDGEPYLAVNPQNSQHIVVAWMGYKFNEIIVIKTKNSHDGGLTWSSEVSIPHVVVGNQSADPSIQFDHLGNVFISYIDYENSSMSNGAVYVTKSTDGGDSWGTPVEVISITDCPNKYCVDRPWMEIDRTTGPNQGTIYITTMNANRNVSAPYNPYLSVSSDGGASFQTPRFLDTTDYLAGDLIPQPMPSPAIGADGVFYAVYPSYVSSQSLYATYIMASSTDGGVTLDHDFIAYGGNGTAVSEANAKKATFFLTDESDASHMTYVTPAGYNGDGDIFFSESFDKGATWSTLERVNQDAVSNGALQDLVWADYNADGDLVITWRDRRNSGNSGYDQPTEIYAGVRLSGSTGFDEMVLSDQVVAHDAILEDNGNDFMCVELIDDTIYAVWGDMRASSLNIYLVKTNIMDGTSSVSQVHRTDIVEAYPNPAVDYVKIKGAKNGEEYLLLDNLGKVVSCGIYYDQIEVKEFSPGVYYLVIKDKEQQVVRFVVE